MKIITMKIGEKIKKFDETLVILIAEMILYGILVEIFGIFLADHLVTFSVGLWCGCLAAGFMAVHMFYSINKMLSLEEHEASNVMRSNAVIRYLVVVCGFFLLFFTKVGSPLSYVIGIFSLKAAAYLQPFFKNIYEKITGTSEET